MVITDEKTATQTETQTALQIALQAEMLANRLQKRYRHLKKWARRTGCDAFRLYDRDIPEIPLVLDLYHRAGAPAIAGALYKRPYDKPPEAEAVWLSAMREAIQDALAVPPENIFIKVRERQRGTSQYQKTGGSAETAVVSEGDLRFIVNLSDYLDTGIFLDARKVRAFLRESAQGVHALNLFCYTGSLSVALAAGGAASVDSVDLSATYLAWARKNFARNGLQDTGNAFRFIRADALSFAAQARNERRVWDLIIVDPPVFSNSKRMRQPLGRTFGRPQERTFGRQPPHSGSDHSGFFDLKRDYRALLDAMLAILAKGGRLLFGVKLKGFSLDAALFPSARITDISAAMGDEDFRSKGAGKWYIVEHGERGT